MPAARGGRSGRGWLACRSEASVPLRGGGINIPPPAHNEERDHRKDHNQAEVRFVGRVLLGNFHIWFDAVRLLGVHAALSHPTTIPSIRAVASSVGAASAISPVPAAWAGFAPCPCHALRLRTHAALRERAPFAARCRTTWRSAN